MSHLDKIKKNSLPAWTPSWFYDAMCKNYPPEAIYQKLYQEFQEAFRNNYNKTITENDGPQIAPEQAAEILKNTVDIIYKKLMEEYGSMSHKYNS